LTEKESREWVINSLLGKWTMRSFDKEAIEVRMRCNEHRANGDKSKEEDYLSTRWLASYSPPVQDIQNSLKQGQTYRLQLEASPRRSILSESG